MAVAMRIKSKAFSIFVFLFSFFALCNGNIFSQNSATLSGTVTDSSYKALEGASVSVFGFPIGTTSDAEGKYSISVPAQAIKIIFSYAGLKTDTFNMKLKAGENGC